MIIEKAVDTLPKKCAQIIKLSIKGLSNAEILYLQLAELEKYLQIAINNKQDRLVVIDDLSVDAPKTKLFAEKLKSMGLEGNLLVITDALNENLYLSSRNLPNVLVLEAQEADPVSLVRFAKVLVTKNAVAKFEEMWG